MSAASTPVSTIGTYLLYKAASSGTTVPTTGWTLAPMIKDYPADGASPELLETTDLSCKRATNILGVQSSEAKEFTLNYIASTYSTLKGVCDGTTEYWWAVAFGEPSSNSYGVDGGFAWKGVATCWKEGAGVNAVREAKISISTGTEPQELTATISTGT